MKALAICGSPHRNGNTEDLLKRALDHLEQAGHETRLLCMSDMEIKPCDDCGICRTDGHRACAIAGDSFAACFQAMLDSDILVVGSPVYFGSATPQLMSLLVRAGCVSRAHGGLFARKLGGPIVVARRAGQNFTFAQLLMWYMVNDFVVPGSSYWNVAFGRGPGEARNDEEGLRTVDRFAENLVWLAEKLG